MKITIEMPSIAACDATSCAYNAEGTCHARAITVGDHLHPACDTFLPADQHVQSRSEAGVGACKVTSCRHNSDYECQASAIEVGRHQDHADCRTFEQS